MSVSNADAPKLIHGGMPLDADNLAYPPVELRVAALMEDAHGDVRRKNAHSSEGNGHGRGDL
jgi:hypothetical protein